MVFRLGVGNAVSYLLTGWFVAVFCVISFAGIAFLLTLLYHLLG